ncbi:chromosome partitioning protein [Natronocella acetinitrilica]|uniref:Chromosome partitioning protein n=1 Tax=Natronocella acetinitrilica TaxID=414046 RepID=A0AAE3G866_9GAMM|nr:ParA family protein [Natronocella acetinitrilica]MCP1675582.1 chromosome partitioning protein [Natronocella acetinitrilica]
MKIWAVSNQKGGVGKTTTAVNLAGLVANRRGRVLLVDLDPHGSMTTYLGYDPEDISPTVYDLFGDAYAPAMLPRMLRGTRVDGIRLMPACTALATLDRQLGARHGKGLVLKRALERLADQFDHVFIDCPPVLGVLMVNALAACDALVIPVQTEFLALKGLERMVNTLEMVQRSRSRELPYTIVPTMFDRRTRASVQTLRELRARFEDQVWEGAIPVDTQFRDASQAGLPLTVLHPWSRGSQAYRKLLENMLGEDVAVTRRVVHE